MSDQISIHIEGIDDYVLSLDKMQAISGRLAPRGEAIRKLSTVTIEAIEQYEGAILDTLGILDQPIGNRALQAVVKHGLESESGKESSLQEKYERRQAISLASWRLLNQGVTVLDPELRIVLSPTLQAAA